MSQLKFQEILYLVHNRFYSLDVFGDVEIKQIAENSYYYFRPQDLFAIPESLYPAFVRDVHREIGRRIIASSNISNLPPDENFPQSIVKTYVVNTISSVNFSNWLTYLQSNTFLSSSEIQDISKTISNLSDERYYIIKLELNL